MEMWRALSTTLNLETVEDKEEEKSIKGMVVGGELRCWRRGTSISPHWSTGKSTGHSVDGLEGSFAQDGHPHLSRSCLLCGALFTLGTLHIEGICIPSVRK